MLCTRLVSGKHAIKSRELAEDWSEPQCYSVTFTLFPRIALQGNFGNNSF